MNVPRIAVYLVATLLLGGLMANCRATGGRGEPEGAPAQEGTATLTAAHVGKTVRAVLRTGSQTVIGKVLSVDAEKDTATVETDYGSRIGFRISQVSVLEVFGVAAKAATPNDGRAELPNTGRFSFADRTGGNPGGVLNPTNVRVVVVDFRHQHKLDDCLRDLAGPLQEAPSTALFSDQSSTVAIRVPIPKNANASLVPFSWHAHVRGGTKENPADALILQNSDGDLNFNLGDHKDARQILLIGTPHRIENRSYGVNAIAPPRMFAIDVFDAAKAKGILENNRAIMSGLDTKSGKLYVASQPANESEMVLSIYDPDKANALILTEAKFSVQDALLFPAFTLSVTDAAGQMWQKLGAYPVPKFLSPEAPDLNRIALETSNSKRGEFSGPAIASIRTAETALVKSDIDVRYAGIRPGQKYQSIVAYGMPTDDKKRLFNPILKALAPDAKYESVNIDLSTVTEENFPSQVFVWNQLSTPWKTTGGYMEGTTPMKAPANSKVPIRRTAVYPAHAPGVHFISFSGPKLNPSSITTPAVLGSNGMGGETIGTGGPFVPFSPIVPMGIIDTGPSNGNGENGSGANQTAAGMMPLIIPAISPQCGCSTSFSSSTASAGAIAIAICNCGGGGCGDGGSGKPDDGGGSNGKNGEPPKNPDTPTPGTDDLRRNPGGFPSGGTPVSPMGGGGGGLSLSSVSGW